VTDSRSNTGSFNGYLDPAKGEWLDSYEGVPVPWVGDMGFLPLNVLGRVIAFP
tara:strand:+ start:876 stop:1034 length:159 start_codon:yes stop_codon:yes gene_type:complete